MRKLIYLLILASCVYVSLFYWQQYTDAPLNERLLTMQVDDIQELIITPLPPEQPFTLSRADDNWVVSRARLQMLDHADRASNLLGKLTGLKTDSVAASGQVLEGVRIQIETLDGKKTELLLHQSAKGTPLAQFTTTGDVFHVPTKAVEVLISTLHFDHFREPRLLNLVPDQVDSIVATYNDSLLWKTDSAVALLSSTILAPAAAPYADHFDEIAHQDRYFADLDFYFSGRAHRVQVFRDSLWPQPYVLVGEDYPRRYLGFEVLGGRH